MTGGIRGTNRRSGKLATSARDEAAGALVSALDSPFLRALTEPARLDLLRLLLLHGPANVGTLAGHLPHDRSVISRHLKVLEQAGIVQGTRQGRERCYALDGPGFIGRLERILEKAKALATCCCPPARPEGR